MKIRTQVMILAACSILVVIFSQVYYYIRFSMLTQERAYNSFSKMTDNIRYQLDSELKQIKDLAWQITSNAITEKYLLNDDYWFKYNISDLIDDYFTGVRTSNRLVSCIYLQSKVDDRVKSNTQETFDKYRDTIVKYRDYEDKTPFFTEVQYDKATGKKFFAFVEPIVPLYKLNAGDDNIAMLYVFCDVTRLSELLPVTADGSDSFFILFDDGMNILTSSKTAEALEIMKTREFQMPERISDTGSILLNDQKYLYHMASVEQMNWKILVVSSLSDLTRDMKPMSYTGTVIGMITLFVFLIFTYIIIRSVNDPLRNMIREMKAIGNMDFHRRLTVRNENEIGLMANNINMLLEEIETRTRRIFKTQDELYNAEIAKKHAQLSSLQSQINPHFLYNTLECMRSISDYYKIDEVSMICGSMANIFRYCTMLKQYVTIHEEIECINEYFNIIRIRFSDRYSMTMDMNPAILDRKIVKMVLQPLVENAVYHGLEKKRGKGSVWINGDYSPDGSIFIQIRDDGIGLESGDLEKLQVKISESCSSNEWVEKNGIGLINIHRRIRLTYGEPFGLSIASEQGQGFTVTVTIPEGQSLLSAN
jgi:two-component system sensor histidine kinase YesM